ncbi:MAG: hypothetical protein JAY90_17890 [Candidatus Thiodiazotropha lotti]|nr:hypothetical protein [Candidatus Thiodiazotropha lotti]ODB98723.1 hypothetical protein A3197_14980 [Candidatus Thiodiazotropha endoloripes]
MIGEHFIKEWIMYQEKTYDDDDTELHWTDDHLFNLMLNGKIEELWQFVIRAYKKDLTQKVIGILSAGALEDVLAAKGEEYIGRVELLAANDQKFKYLLGGVWKNAMSNDVWSRVQAAAEPWE